MSPSTFNRIYLWAPSWLKNAAASAVGLRNNKMRRGRYFHERYAALMANASADNDQLANVQRSELGQLLRAAYEYSPYYRRAMEELAQSPIRLIEGDPLELLAALPPLEKSDLRENLADIVSSDPRRKTVSVTYTSGTTGTPMAVEVDSESLQETFAEWERYYRWMGLPERFRSARLSGRIIVQPDASKPPFWVVNRASQQLFMSTYHLSSRNMPAYVRRLSAFRPNLIDGYPSAIYVLAKFINATETPLGFTPVAISTTAETLHEYQREEIEKAFGCPVFNQYASSEGAPWIVQCARGSYHLWTDTGVFEFLNPRETAAGDVYADLVVTSFRAKKTPLIRYKIGDTIQIGSDDVECPCGSGFPTIAGVVGREEDLLFTRQRGSVGRLDTAYKGLQGIIRSKIIQTDEDRIEVQIVPTESYTTLVERQLVDNLRDRLGDIEIAVKLVDDIPPGTNGKFKAVENRMKLS